LVASLTYKRGNILLRAAAERRGRKRVFRIDLESRDGQPLTVQIIKFCDLRDDKNPSPL
jgi:hypothetical protein